MTTNKELNYRNYIDLLKDETFVQWRIAPSEEVTGYWESIIDKNPRLKIETLKADNYLRKHFSDENQLTEKDKSELFNSIVTSVSKTERKKSLPFKLLPYVAAACVILFVAGGLLLYYKNNKQYTGLTTLVEGSTQTPEDIQLITGNTVSTFAQDVEIKVNNEMVFINEGTTSEKKIDIRDNTTINKLIVPYGKRSFITLSDGSKVWLNSGTELEFPSNFTGSIREIKVKGEIFAEIASDKQKPFYVYTRDFSVQVYGTKFNISSHPEEKSSVVLVEGSVKLVSSNNNLFLAPNEMGEINEQTGLTKKTINPQEYISWKEGYLTLNNTPISDVLQKVGRIYNVKFGFDENLHILNIKCSGKLDLSDNIDDVMRAIAAISNTNYIRDQNTIYINKYLKQ